MNGNLCLQWYHYDWNKVGQLVRARRWDYESEFPGVQEGDYPADTPAWDLHFAYSLGVRILKSAKDAAGERHTVEIFDSLRLQQVPFRESTEQYRREGAYSHAYVGGGLGHVFYDREETLPHANPDTLIHTYLSFGDHLGSTSFVIDKDSSELVERAEHQPYGAIESDYRPHRWESAREDYKFTGKEEDIEIGLTYFGARYYHARLGRWASADPLTIHGLGSDLNPYAYVAGRVSSAVDRFGLDGCVVASYTHGNGTTVEMTESCGAQRASILSMHYPTQAQRDQQLATFVQAQTVSVSKDAFDKPASTRMPGGPGWGRPIDPKQILPGVWNGLVDLYQPVDVMGYFLFKPLLENTRTPESGNRGYALGHSLPAVGAAVVPIFGPGGLVGLSEAAEELAIQEASAARAGVVALPRHHVFPQQHRAFFQARGFVGRRSIDRYTLELDQATHEAIHGGGNWWLARSWGGAWNNQIMTRIGQQEQFLGRPLTFGETMKVGGGMTRDYGLGGLDWVPYR